jgi:hypothetical protein
MSNFSKGKYAQFISDQSGMAFPYKEMVTQWDGLKVHVSEFDPKQPQLEPKPHGADPQGLPMAKPDRTEPETEDLLQSNPFIITVRIIKQLMFMNHHTEEQQETLLYLEM